MRTFEIKKTKRFWNIQRTGKTITVNWGKIGGKPTARSSDSPDQHRAMMKYQEQIAEKLRDGYKETTSDDLPGMDSTGRALEEAMAEDPDDLAATMAFADWLSEQADPRHQARSEFIRVQLQLEDESLPAAQQKKLKKREKELLKANERHWLGWRLADVLIDGGGNPGLIHSTKIDELRTYRRGRLDRLAMKCLNEEIARTILASPLARTIRELDLDYCEWGEDSLGALRSSDALRNLRSLHLHDSNDEDQIDQLVASFPHIEELQIDAFDYDVGSLFQMKNLGNLRKMHIEDANAYNVEALAKNTPPGRRTQVAPASWLIIPTACQLP
jgi:uncharacterized protein (TIGR02996 family)